MSILQPSRKRRMSILTVGSLECLSTSLGKSLGTSFKRDGFSDLYNFQFAAKSPVYPPSPSKDLVYFSGLEDKLCKDFSCCGLILDDLHQLLQHFEECHHEDDIHMDSDEEEALFEFEAMDESDYSDVDSPLTFTDVYFKSHRSSPSISLSEIYVDPRSNIKKKLVTSSTPATPVPVGMDMMDEDAPSTIMALEPCSFTDESMDMSKEDRPYKCKILGCAKSYKNPGGLKYHMQHGHCEDTGDPEMNTIIQKPYQCTVADCGRRYKNLNGLKYHIEHSHSTLLNPLDSLESSPSSP